MTGKSFSPDLPESPPSQVLAECYEAFERSADLDVSFTVEDGRVVAEVSDATGSRRLRPSDVFGLLD